MKIGIINNLDPEPPRACGTFSITVVLSYIKIIY